MLSLQVKIGISSIGWDLLDLEQAAHLVVAEENERLSMNPFGTSNSQGASEKPLKKYTATQVTTEVEQEPSPSVGTSDVCRRLTVNVQSPCTSNSNSNAANCGSCLKNHQQSVAILEPTMQALSAGVESLLTLRPSENSNLSSCIANMPLIEELPQQLDTADADVSHGGSTLSSDSCSSEDDSDTSESVSNDSLKSQPDTV